MYSFAIVLKLTHMIGCVNCIQYFLGGELQSCVQQKRLTNGAHNFLGPTSPSQIVITCSAVAKLVKVEAWLDTITITANIRNYEYSVLDFLFLFLVGTGGVVTILVSSMNPSWATLLHTSFSHFSTTSSDVVPV